ncbi:MAG: transposase [Anaerolineales bacterium]|jgi:putative transposase
MTTKLHPSVCYHIYNRGNNRADIFREERNYTYFLQLYARHIAPIAETYAYCLLKNHFHLLIRVKDAPVGEAASQKFSNFFNAYAKAFNRSYQRTGALFQRPFQRIPLTNDSHLQALVAYIHYNPQKHGFVADYREWPYSSYPVILSMQPTYLTREQILESFGGRDRFLEYHSLIDLTGFQNLSGLDFDL